ncbi:MAG: GNAT family N-acetyltransferase [Kurthia sp.]|nr:GNAT family N-acetyltransferase [Candidatus Kurthia equi]
MPFLRKEFLGETPVYVRHLTMEDMELIETLQQEVYEALPIRSVLQPLTTEEYEYILTKKGMMIGVFADDELIGFRALVSPEVDEEHLGYDCGIPEEKFSRVLYQEISNVSPKYRGHNLQKKMAQWIMEEIDLNLYDYVCSTVQPLNIPSLKDKFSQNLIVKALKIKYVDKLRYVFFKDLTAQEPAHYKEQVYILMSDTEGQQALLKDGYVGTSMHLDKDEWYVVYER